MIKLTETHLKLLQEALYQDYGIRLEGKALYDAAYSLTAFFEALVNFGKLDKEKKEVRKES